MMTHEWNQETRIGGTYGRSKIEICISGNNTLHCEVSTLQYTCCYILYE